MIFLAERCLLVCFLFEWGHTARCKTLCVTTSSSSCLSQLPDDVICKFWRCDCADSFFLCIHQPFNPYKRHHHSVAYWPIPTWIWINQKIRLAVYRERSLPIQLVHQLVTPLPNYRKADRILTSDTLLFVFITILSVCVAFLRAKHWNGLLQLHFI